MKKAKVDFLYLPAKNVSVLVTLLGTHYLENVAFKFPFTQGKRTIEHKHKKEK